ncbi:MAG: class I SAM-dependent methyltransferase [Candidatus Sericytochromatia bacterium]
MTGQASVDHRFFAWFYRFMSRHESEPMQAWRRENLADLSGRVLEIGAGTGTNFALYPSTVTEVIAIESERRLAEIARAAAKSAPVPVTVTDRTIEMFDPVEPFDAAVCSLVLCRVDNPNRMLRQVFSLLRPVGQLRYLEHVASDGMPGRLQRLADATGWPRLFGNCHMHRDTEGAIADSGFGLQTTRHDQAVPSSPARFMRMVHGRAVRPAPTALGNSSLVGPPTQGSPTDGAPR